MCDTMWKKFENGGIFAKNSDRSCNEPNLVQFFPGGETNAETVKCTYIEIPEVKNKQAVLLVKPSWIWGAEMGINESGVVIGNEAVFTSSKGKSKKRLLGMDMLRLALERGSSAKEALETLIVLLEMYGQGGNCAFDKTFFYDNSFLVADKFEAYIMETSGFLFKTKKLDSFGNISNRLSIDEDDFASKNTNKLITHFAGALKRQNSGCLSISSSTGIKEVFASLRTHDNEDDTTKLYEKGSVSSVCMHQSILGDQTTGSMVVDSRGENPFIWITGSSTPCISIFKPVVFGEIIPPVFASAEESYNYWLKREYLNRAIFAGVIDTDLHRERAQEIEDRFIKEAEELINKGAKKEELIEFALRCYKEEESFVDSYSEIIEGVKEGQIKLPKLWAKKTKKLGVNVFR